MTRLSTPTDDTDDAVAHAGEIWHDFAGAKVLVTGGTGFLGRWLVSSLVRADERFGLDLALTCLTRSPQRFARECPELAGNRAVTLLQGDVRFFHYPSGAFTHVIHGAVDTSHEADSRPFELFDTIVDGTRRTLSFALAAGVRKFLFLSSGAVYGPQPAGLEALPETYSGSCSTTDPQSNYGECKRAAEQLCTLFRDRYNLEIKIARLFALMGPHMNFGGHFAAGNFIRDAVLGQPIRLSSDGSQIRSYLYASDAAAWLLRILVDGRNGAAYNVGSDQATTLAGLAERIASLVTSSKGVSLSSPASASQARNRYVPDISLARTELGLDAWTDLDTAIRRTSNWLARRENSQGAAGVSEVTVPAQPKKFVIDIDGIVASLTPNNDYTLATPSLPTIALINQLYDAGHRIIMFTARGSETGIDWYGITANQLALWGVKHHELRVGKPAADYYVDDRMLSVNQLRELADALT